ncbi:MAG: pyruvate kinase [Patescibacteria group bacterium]|jgi:pyruvate kinase|nr:pyruvate kinase [Patescibacteria group bacterium]
MKDKLECIMKIDTNIRKIKIVATLGPASSRYIVISKLIKEGVDIFRFNLKYGSQEEHSQVIDSVRKASSKIGRKVAILIDLPRYNHSEGIQLAFNKKSEYVAVSYIKKSDEVVKLKKEFKKIGLLTNIIAKIETEESLFNFKSILEKTDSLMVARGDLGRSIPIEKVPFAQKEIVLSCRKKNEIVIVATEMLLSMVSNKKPTRAEASDVANAVLDGANAVMLSEETAIGANPVEAVRIMSKIIYEAESWEKLGHLDIVSRKNKNFKFGV